MSHDFKAFPELTNAQMPFYYFESPHKQIFESFSAQVQKVHDGDTITVRWSERDFDFPIRFIDIAAPEVGGKKGLQPGGRESQQWLEALLLGNSVDIAIDPNNRVEKWGRLLGKVYFTGISVGQESVDTGHSVWWENRNDGLIADRIGEVGKWF